MDEQMCSDELQARSAVNIEILELEDLPHEPQSCPSLPGIGGLCELRGEWRSIRKFPSSSSAQRHTKCYRNANVHGRAGL